MRIKEGNEWKEAFTIYMGFFEPTVMFFGITNLLATFQAMMNEILRDIINKGKLAIFVDVLQMATYWFVIAWFDNQSVQKSKVRQAAKDVVKSEVYFQIYSP